MKQATIGSFLRCVYLIKLYITWILKQVITTTNNSIESLKEELTAVKQQLRDKDGVSRKLISESENPGFFFVGFQEGNQRTNEVHNVIIKTLVIEGGMSSNCLLKCLSLFFLAHHCEACSKWLEYHLVLCMCMIRSKNLIKHKGRKSAYFFYQLTQSSPICYNYYF